MRGILTVISEVVGEVVVYLLFLSSFSRHPITYWGIFLKASGIWTFGISRNFLNILFQFISRYFVLVPIYNRLQLASAYYISAYMNMSSYISVCCQLVHKYVCISSTWLGLRNFYFKTEKMPKKKCNFFSSFFPQNPRLSSKTRRYYKNKRYYKN